MKHLGATVSLFTVTLLLSGSLGQAIPADRLLGNVGGLLFNGHSNPKAKCFKCHDSDGTGTRFGRDLTQIVADRTDEQLLQVILLGKNKMPAHGEKLSAEEIKALVTYLRASFNTRPVSPEADRVY